MPIFLLIRHGENEYVKTGRMAARLPGVHLNDRGREQAAALAACLKEAPLAAIYSSPLERAMETAAPIASERGLPIKQIPGLMDTDVGDWAGQELKKISKLPEWKTVQNQPSRFRFPGGESFLELQTRLIGEFEALASAHKREDLVAVVFHADPIKLVTAYYLGMPLDHFQRLACDTGSVTILGLGEHGVMLIKQNLTPPFTLPSPPKKKK
jgi:probable phosphoglycerate mutase